MASTSVTVDVRVDVDGINAVRAMIVLLAVVYAEARYRAEAAPGQTRGDWFAVTPLNIDVSDRLLDRHVINGQRRR